MLTFVIPVKSRTVTSDWTKFSQLFERTLRSVCNQTDNYYRVVIVCHEIPEVSFTHENIEYIHPDFQPPSREHRNCKEYLIKKRIDKGEKIKIGVDYAVKEFNTDYVMLVDSDDFISNRIAAFVNGSKIDEPGWYIGRGFLSFKWKSILVVAKKFSYLCGSSLIVKPGLIKHFFDRDKIDLYFDHRLTTLNSNIELKKVPFNAGIYNIGNGENIFMSFQNVKKLNNHGNWISMQSLKRLYSKFRNYSFKFITPRLRREFHFYPVVEQQEKQPIFKTHKAATVVDLRPTVSVEL